MAQETWQKWFVGGERWYALPDGERVLLKRGSQAEAVSLGRDEFTKFMQEIGAQRDPFSYCAHCQRDLDPGQLGWVLGYTERGPRALCPDHSPFKYRPASPSPLAPKPPTKS